MKSQSPINFVDETANTDTQPEDNGTLIKTPKISHMRILRILLIPEKLEWTR